MKYLNMVTWKLKNRFFLGGHSKGGNLAVYAAMKCSDQVRERMIKVYSMDGPGFRPQVLASSHYEALQDKMVKILPQSSVVGMLFENDIRYKTVASKTFGLAQHNPYKWLVKDGHFVEVEDIHEHRMRMDETINEWILSLDAARLQLFVDTLYQIISASEADNLIDFTADLKKSMTGIVNALKEVDDETVKMLKEIVKSLFEIAKEKLFARKQPLSREGVDERGKVQKKGESVRS